MNSVLTLSIFFLRLVFVSTGLFTLFERGLVFLSWNLFTFYYFFLDSSLSLAAYFSRYSLLSLYAQLLASLRIF